MYAVGCLALLLATGREAYEEEMAADLVGCVAQARRPRSLSRAAFLWVGVGSRG